MGHAYFIYSLVSVSEILPRNGVVEFENELLCAALLAFGM